MIRPFEGGHGLQNVFEQRFQKQFQHFSRAMSRNPYVAENKEYNQKSYENFKSACCEGVHAQVEATVQVQNTPE